MHTILARVSASSVLPWCKGRPGAEQHLWGELEVEAAQQHGQHGGVVHLRKRLADAVAAAVAEGYEALGPPASSILPSTVEQGLFQVW